MSVVSAHVTLLRPRGGVPTPRHTRSSSCRAQSPRASRSAMFRSGQTARVWACPRGRSPELAVRRRVLLAPHDDDDPTDSCAGSFSPIGGGTAPAACRSSCVTRAACPWDRRSRSCWCSRRRPPPLRRRDERVLQERQPAAARPVDHPVQADVGQPGIGVPAADNRSARLPARPVRGVGCRVWLLLPHRGLNGARFSSIASAWKAASTVVLRSVSWNCHRRLSQFTQPSPVTGMPNAPTVSQTPMNRIRVSYE